MKYLGVKTEGRGLVIYQSFASQLGEYSRTDHTHTSSDISDSITRIGTHASANKLVKTDANGFLEIIHPNDDSPDKSIITKKILRHENC